MDNQNDERAAAILGRQAQGLLALDDVLVELADADCVTTIAALIAGRLRMKPDMVGGALDAGSDEPISVMCRAAGFNLNGFSALLRMRRRRNQGRQSAAAGLGVLFFAQSGGRRPRAATDDAAPPASSPPFPLTDRLTDLLSPVAGESSVRYTAPDAIFSLRSRPPPAPDAAPAPNSGAHAGCRMSSRCWRSARG